MSTLFIGIDVDSIIKKKKVETSKPFITKSKSPAFILKLTQRVLSTPVQFTITSVLTLYSFGCFVDGDGDRFPDYMEAYFLTFERYADIDGDGDPNAYDSDVDGDNLENILGNVTNFFFHNSKFKQLS